MRTAFVAPLLVAGAYSLPEIHISKRDAQGRSSEFARGITRRSGTLTTNVFDIGSYSAGGAYYANVTVGTNPPQNQVVILDTGSSDLYFDASTSKACTTSGPNSCRGGSFDVSKSSTYKEVEASPAFNTSFGDGSTAYGPYGTDYVGIGDVVIGGVQFGVAETADSETGYALGLLGLGYTTIEAIDPYTGSYYPNMPEVLVDAGVIASRLFSVFLNSVDKVSGTILFGGIDTSKYTGPLVTLNLLPTAIQDTNGRTIEAVFEYVSTVTALEVTSGGSSKQIFSGGSNTASALTTSKENVLPVLLDTGSAAWTIPSWVMDKFNSANVFSYVDQNSGTCSCKYRDNDDSMTLEFGGKIKITVPNHEFIVPYYDPDTNEPVLDSNGDEICIFMLSPDDGDDEGGFLTLGDSILRSMYVVFDMDNGQISIAQANVDGNQSPNVVTIGSGPSGIASAITESYSPAANTNSYSVIGKLTSTPSYTVSTAATTIGTATGTAAEPTDAVATGTAAEIMSSGKPHRPSGETGGTSVTAAATGPTASPSKGAASGLVVPSVGSISAWSFGVGAAMAIFGAALIL